MRPELEPLEPSSEKIADIRALLSRIRVQIDDGPLCHDLKKQFREVTGFKRDPEVILGDINMRNLGNLAEELAYGPPPILESVTREDLIYIVEMAFTHINNPGRMNWYCHLFDRNVAMPKASDLLFFPPQDLAVETVDYEPSSEEIVDRALAYKPLSL